MNSATNSPDAFPRHDGVTGRRSVTVFSGLPSGEGSEFVPLIEPISRFESAAIDPPSALIPAVTGSPT